MSRFQEETQRFVEACTQAESAFEHFGEVVDQMALELRVDEMEPLPDETIEEWAKRWASDYNDSITE